MFGYIAPRMELLNEAQKKRYTSVYCGLCRGLGEISGRSGRILLSHDMTFLALLLSSLQEPKEEQSTFRCAVHPVKPRSVVRSRAVQHASAMNVLLMDQKLEDQILDDGSRLAAAEKKKLRPAVEQAEAEYPRQSREIRESLKAIWLEEKSERPDADRLCNLCGEMLGSVFSPEWTDSFWTPALKNLGRGLGRFIYWMDAWEDLPADRKKGRFNPLDCPEYRERDEEFVRAVMEMLIAEAAEHFETLPLEKDIDLLRNVLYSGVWQRYDVLKKRRGKGEKE